VRVTGSHTTPAHSNRDFVFTDYMPNVFRRIRGLFGIDPTDYLLSLTAEYQLSEIISPGKVTIALILSLVSFC
jgi:1-phosphatidylinositol-4-phosphate 5-kinase